MNLKNPKTGRSQAYKQVYLGNGICLVAEISNWPEVRFLIVLTFWGAADADPSA